MRLSTTTLAGVRAGAERTMDRHWFRLIRTEVDGPFSSVPGWAVDPDSKAHGRVSPVSADEVPTGLQEAILNRRVFRFVTTMPPLMPEDRIGDSGDARFEVIGDMDVPGTQSGTVVRAYLVAQVAGE